MLKFKEKTLRSGESVHSIVRSVLLDEGNGSLKREPRNVRELCYELNFSGSTVKQHLNGLKTYSKVAVIGKDVKSVKERRRCTFLYSLVPRR